MSGRITLCTILLVSALLLPTPASADSSQDLLGQAWSWLSALWSDLGCGIDPDGSTCAQPKARGCIDPNGSDCIKATVEPKLRCGIDPNGNTVCSPNTSLLKHGCGIDPDGRPVCVP